MDEHGRTLGAHVMIAAAIIVGFQMILVGPARDRLDDASHEIAELSAEVSSLDDPIAGAVRLRDREKSVAATLERVERWNTLLDPAELATLVERFGHDAGVTVERIDPSASDPRDRTGARSASSRLLPTGAVTLRIEARGTYAQIATFIAALYTRQGYTRMDEVVLRPSLRPGLDEVSASISTSQFAFDPRGFVSSSSDSDESSPS